MDSRRTVISLHGLTRRFGDAVAVNDLSLDLEEGEFFALLGPSGCGKTTLLRIIAGFETPDHGSVLLDGEDITALRPNRRPVNMMFQSYALFPHMTVTANVRYGLEMERLPAAEIRARVEAILEKTQLSALSDRRPGELSGGQRQRVALARAIVKEPRVLLLDEPLGALDRKLREQMQIELKRLQHELGITFVVVTHDQEEALVMADRIALMRDGQIIQVDTPRGLYDRPNSRFVADFIGESGFIAGKVADAGLASDHHGLLPVDDPSMLATGSRAVIAIRPERIRVSTERPTAGPAVSGVVDGVAYHGEGVKLMVAVAGMERPLVARVPAERAGDELPGPGDEVWCGWDPVHGRLLPEDPNQTITRHEKEPSDMTQKTFAFFPEAAFGPALNSVGIAQAVEKLGHRAVFLSDPGFVEVYQGYGFEAHPVNLSEPMPPEEMAKFWTDFINGHIPNFRKPPIDQVDNYVKDCWGAIVDSAKWAEKDLPGVLDSIKPDVVCVDNVIMFPAIKRYAAENGVPWVRVISCSENEIEDPAIPPHLSGCGENDSACHAAYRERFNTVIKPIHDDYNAFLASCGEAPYKLGEFFEASPHMNLLLYPEPVKFKRSEPLDPARFQYLEGCVRKDEDYAIPTFKANNDKPLLYVSYGSLGAGDTDLLKRVIKTIAGLPVRALVNVGDYESEYGDMPDNVIIQGWYPQPSVIPQVDLVIHHGGNNSFTECLYFGKPAIIMPYVWDGHDNATRVQETGHGFKLDRYDWDDAALAEKINAALNDEAMKAKLAATSAHMQGRHGPTKAAQILDGML